MMNVMSQGVGLSTESVFALIILAALVLTIFIFVSPVTLTVYLSSEKKKQKIPRSPLVLVVDDDESSILSLLSILETKSATVKVLQSGEQMMKELAHQEYDVVFIDREMPYLRGEAALAAVDEHLSLNRRIPVVFFTGSEQDFTIPEVNQFSVLGVWAKRLTYKKLEEKVSLLLRNIRNGGRLAYD